MCNLQRSVWGPKKTQRRVQLESRITKHLDLQDHQFVGLPWAVLGDFNQTVTVHDSYPISRKVTGSMKAFQDCINSCELEDLTFRGGDFTWWNKRFECPIMKKIDRILVNSHWLSKYPDSFGVFSPPLFSDHTASCVSLGLPKRHVKRPFQYSSFLSTNNQFLEEVKQCWDSIQVEGTAMYKLVMKLTKMKRFFRDYNRQHFSGIERRVAQAEADLTNCQQNLLANLTPGLINLEKELHSSWSTLVQAEEKFLKQRARVEWAANGDSNSSFFHKAVKERQQRNKICYLINERGTKLESDEEIKDECISFYKELLGTQEEAFTDDKMNTLRPFIEFRCTEQQKSVLATSFTPAEITNEFLSLPKCKSPGPDGYSGEFFRDCWSVVGEDVICAVQEFFGSAKLLKQLNATAIALIPKRNGADRIGDFRPISLCNSIYKVISRLLATRLQSILPGMISTNQSAFVKGRLLIENVLLATELVQGMQRKNGPKMAALQIDLRKAFDSVHWEFILAVLCIMDFPPIYLAWIRECITTSSFSLKINGELCGYFQGKKGLRQGDALSPFLFVVAMEVFGKMLTMAYDRQQIGYHPKGQNPRVTHLAFADDVMVFFDGSHKSLKGILTVLEQFHYLSGLQMNAAKSVLFISKKSRQASEIINTEGILLGTLPVRYLGLPLMNRKLRLNEFSPLIEAIQAKFSTWKVKHLSYGGRLELLKSVIYSTINFWCSAFLLPKVCVKRIEKMCRRFLWSGQVDENCASRVAWTTVCSSKEHGGLGLRNIQLLNKVFLLKLAWRLHTSKDSLWIAWIRSHYLKDDWYWTVNTKVSDSWIWRSIINLRPLAQLFLKSKVGNGENTSFWTDNWAEDQILLQLGNEFTPLRTGIPLHSSVAAAYNLKPWPRPVQRLRAPDVCSVWNHLNKLHDFQLQEIEDTWIWAKNREEAKPFSTHYTWNSLQPLLQTVLWHKSVWFKGYVPKYAFLFWLAMQDKLAVKERLHQWRIVQDPLCILCGSNIEDRDHVLLRCDVSEVIWRMVMKRLCGRQCSFMNWGSLESWLLTSTAECPKTLKCLASQVTTYHIWRERNSRLFNGVSLSPTNLFQLIDRKIKDILLARMHRNQFKNLLQMWFRWE